ncbi:L-threonylcarbamoyladenylate synthase [Yanghanlia caeni]|uniref:Threonylcarbamoyl-AMP synthase n=1 Tax=Yanghanlia caeni TaxID=3064283 RepID=A0ABU1D325_9BURK|nr:L-threonylcarbamoyladenylate synthase [Alcaligenaceae bacterium LG-2]HZH55678.1 L-threonylcarbamoyladenylate synthase [Burkholderiaceae bacterium]
MMTAEPQADDIRRAAERLAQGGLVAFPTETVYGLGADAENPAAIARIYAAKGRPSDHPVIVHLAPGADLAYWACNIPDEAHALVRAFWPGPLTLILPRAPGIPDAVSGGQDTIGLRCPSHPVAQALLRSFAGLKGGQGGVAAPSANKFGQVSPTQAAHVRNEFPELGASDLMVLEGGPSQVGIESTIVDLSRLDQGRGPVLLRPGHITAHDLAAVLGVVPARPDAAAPRVSGSLKAHYAPRTPLLLAERAGIDAIVANAAHCGERVAVAAFEPFRPLVGVDALPSGVTWVQCATDAGEYARHLYALLRRLDEGGYERIVLERPPVTPVWQAVNDRLGRAAAAFE